MASAVVTEIARQVREVVFLPKTARLFEVDENTLRVHFGRTNIDIAYDAGHDLYTVSQHHVSRKPGDVTTTTTRHVFAEDLASYFPERIRKDDNVRGLFASMRAIA